ncbi:MAG: integrase core domain-containing protein [Nitrososphaerales archaeon]
MRRSNRSIYSVMALENALREHGKPASILSDHGTTFYSMESERREKGMTEFEKCLLKHKIRFIVSRVRHPQTNGKIEKFFDIFENKIKWFSSIEEFMKWYNEVRPHEALDLKTPVEASYAKMPQLDAIEYPSFMEAQSWMRNDYRKKNIRIRLPHTNYAIVSSFLRSEHRIS